jgi:hypothetical protein
MTHLEVHKAPFVDERGEAHRHRGFGARRHRAHPHPGRTAPQVEALYKLVAEHVSDVIWLYDLVAERFTYVSPSVQQAARLHG